MDKIKKVEINTPYITLQQLLKFVGILSFGGEAKMYLSENEVFVNDELENRRGGKLYPGDVVKVEGFVLEICLNENK